MNTISDWLNWSKYINIYLDDERPVPDGWIGVKTATSCIELLRNNNCKFISLDHDLGDDLEYGTGYDVIVWIEEQVATNDKFKCPEIFIHTANSSARIKMNLAHNSIINMLNKKV